MIDFIRHKILLKFVFKHLVWFSLFIICFWGTNDGSQSQLRIHVLMYGCRAVVISLTCQIDCHAPVTIDTIVFMIDFMNLCLDFCFMGVIIRLPVFPVVIVSVRINFQPSKQPADTECLMILVNKSISL